MDVSPRKPGSSSPRGSPYPRGLLQAGWTSGMCTLPEIFDALFPSWISSSFHPCFTSFTLLAVVVPAWNTVPPTVTHTISLVAPSVTIGATGMLFLRDSFDAFLRRLDGVHAGLAELVFGAAVDLHHGGVLVLVLVFSAQRNDRWQGGHAAVVNRCRWHGDFPFYVH